MNVRFVITADCKGAATAAATRPLPRLPPAAGQGHPPVRAAGHRQAGLLRQKNKAANAAAAALVLLCIRAPCTSPHAALVPRVNRVQHTPTSTLSPAYRLHRQARRCWQRRWQRSLARRSSTSPLRRCRASGAQHHGHAALHGYLHPRTALECPFGIAVMQDGSSGCHSNADDQHLRVFVAGLARRHGWCRRCSSWPGRCAFSPFTCDAALLSPCLIMVVSCCGMRICIIAMNAQLMLPRCGSDLLHPDVLIVVLIWQNHLQMGGGTSSHQRACFKLSAAAPQFAHIQPRRFAQIQPWPFISHRSRPQSSSSTRWTHCWGGARRGTTR